MQVEDQSIGGIDYSIELINHTLDKENILDIKPMVSEFVYSEDINIPFTSLTLLIADSLGLAELFPLVGDELIGIKFKSDTQENYIQKLFKINSISNRKILQERSHVYVIEALSLEFFKNKTSSFERSYKGKTGSDIVKNVYENQLKSVYYDDVAVIPKPLSVEESSNLITVNSNTQSPFNFIKQVSHYSYNTEYKSSVYRFYEDMVMNGSTFGYCFFICSYIGSPTPFISICTLALNSRRFLTTSLTITFQLFCLSLNILTTSPLVLSIVNTV